MADLGIYRKLGSSLIDEGKKFLQKATPVKKTVYTASMILTALRNVTGLAVERIYSADEKHYTTDLDTWKIILDNDWTNKKQWIADYFDCDNFAGSFTAYCADIYGLNSAARITVELKDPVTGVHIGWHRCAVIIDSNLECWLLETQTDEMTKMEAGKKLVIGNWWYIPYYVDIN